MQVDFMTKCQKAICRYLDVPAAEAQSRYVQMTPEEHGQIVGITSDFEAGKSIGDDDDGTPVYASLLETCAKVKAVWEGSCARRKAEAETQEIEPELVSSVAETTGTVSVENPGIELAKDLAAE
jgi:hypothetical protein